MGSPVIRYESGQTAYPREEMIDSGDAVVFEASFFPISNALAEPAVALSGLSTGGAITPHATANTVAVAALTASMAGGATADASGVVAVAGASVLVTRPATAVSKVVSITVNNAGALAAVSGTDGATAAFVETRGAAGGPPLIPVDSIEIGQVRMTTTASAAITAGQIYTVPGLHVERSDYPGFKVRHVSGEVEFSDALPKIHAGLLPRKVYIQGATPLFEKIEATSDWVPAENSYSISSTDTYDGPVGSSSASLGQASFTALVKNGITENFISHKGKNLWFEFRPDADKTVPKQLTQGVFGISRTNPAGGGSRVVSCTVTPSSGTVDIKA